MPEQDPADATPGVRVWHPDKIRAAVDRTRAAVRVGHPEGTYRINGKPVTWSDLACLLDVAATALATARPAPITLSPEDVRHAVANARLAGRPLPQDWQRLLLDVACGRRPTDDTSRRPQ